MVLARVGPAPSARGFGVVLFDGASSRDIVVYAILLCLGRFLADRPVFWAQSGPPFLTAQESGPTIKFAKRSTIRIVKYVSGVKHSGAYRDGP